MRQRAKSIDPFPGDGEMSRRMRAHDWSATPLGPVESWPQSLRIAVCILLNSRYAMWLGWGPDFTFFYNDAYARMTLGAKHPWALGRPAREVWAEIWGDIGPRAESVVRTGKATWDERLLLFLERRGFPEETYHTFSYSPVPDDHGGVGGMLCVVIEDTERTIGERRLRTLRELAARTTEEARSVEDACQTAARILAGNPQDVPFILLYLVDADARAARLAGATGLPPGSPAAPPAVDLTAAAGPNAGWPLRAVLETGRAEVVMHAGRWLGSIPLGSGHLPRDHVGGSRGLAPTAAGASLFVEEALRWLPHDEPDEDSAELPPDPEDLSAPILPARQAEGDRPRVLVADDNADMRRYVLRLLAGEYAVEAVPDGAAALEAVRRQTPDLILSDVMMPRLDGFGLLQALRADPHTAGVPVILLSARAGEESRVEGMQAGADDYLVKPFSARELLARVSAHLQMARLRREASESLRASEQRFQSFMNHSPTTAFIKDGEGRYVFVNRTLERQFARPLAGWVGKTDFDLFPPEEARLLRQNDLSVLTSRKTGRFEEVSTRPDGPRHYLSFKFPLQDRDGSWLLAGMSIDITEQKQAEEALRQANRRKDEFLAMLAHELRNPLAPIRNALQVLKMARLDGATAERTREIMERQVHHLVRLVDDLLDVSRVMRGKVELRKEPVELASVVARAVETAQGLIEAQGQELTIRLPDESLPLDADPVRLAQVVGNLLTNAAKYTDSDGRISLTARREGGQAVLCVRDTGIGIPPDMLPKVFDLFVQVDHATTKAQGGLGIGLTLVKSLVEMHGGTVEAHSPGPGEGSEFVVRLPLLTREQDPPGKKEAGDQPQPHSSGRRLLVVDDNRDAAESLALLLRLQGHEVRVAHDGRAALEMVSSYRPEMIFLDIGMPGMDGYEVARRLKQMAGMPGVRLAALTGWGQQEDRRRTSQAGFDYHLVKPVEPEALEELLATLKQAK
jgi:PAS domain S-box-containing protein